MVRDVLRQVYDVIPVQNYPFHPPSLRSESKADFKNREAGKKKSPLEKGDLGELTNRYKISLISYLNPPLCCGILAQVTTLNQCIFYSFNLVPMLRVGTVRGRLITP